MRLVISTMGDHVLVEAVGRDSTMLETITPDEARAYARRLIFASAKARQNAVGKYRQPVPEGSTVGEAEDDDDLCPSCPNYVGKCPKCGRPRPSIDEVADDGDT